MPKKYQKNIKKWSLPHGKIEPERRTVVKNRRLRCSGEGSKNDPKNLPKSSQIHPQIHPKIDTKRCPEKVSENDRKNAGKWANMGTKRLPKVAQSRQKVDKFGAKKHARKMTKKTAKKAVGARRP